MMSSPPLICIVDDDAVLRASVADLMRAGGYATAEFPDAVAFLASDDKSRCQCVIADIQMPGMTGIDLRRAMVAEGLTTPVIIITALADDHWSLRAAEAGAGFLRKPLDAQALFGLLDRSLAA
jgi:FixJ family two-component response regulator